MARVEAFVAKLRRDGYGACIYESAAEIGDIIADTPFKSYTEPTCSRPEGHAGGCLFNSHDGRTPLEVMPK